MQPVFALLVRHGAWLMNHLVCYDFQVEADGRVIKTSPYESHTRNSASKTTKLQHRIWFGRRDAEGKQQR